MGTIRKLKTSIQEDQKLSRMLIRSGRHSVLLDLDGDHMPDIALFDLNQDGDSDALAVDLTGNGEFNFYLIDHDGNGIPDQISFFKDGGDAPVKSTFGPRVEAEMKQKVSQIHALMTAEDIVADQILDECSVARVLIPVYAKESKQHTQFMEALGRSAGTQVTEMGQKETLELDFGAVHLGVTSAHELDYGWDEENDFSLATRLVYGKTRFFFTGDAEGPRQRELLEEGDVACDVLKVPYHGREVEVSEEFLSACAPKIAWIPDSQEEPVGEAVVQYLKEQLGASVYRSAEDGDLTVRSDGERVWTAEE